MRAFISFLAKLGLHHTAHHRAPRPDTSHPVPHQPNGPDVRGQPHDRLFFLFFYRRRSATHQHQAQPDRSRVVADGTREPQKHPTPRRTQSSRPQQPKNQTTTATTPPTPTNVPNRKPKTQTKIGHTTPTTTSAARSVSWNLPPAPGRDSAPPQPAKNAGSATVGRPDDRQVARRHGRVRILHQIGDQHDLPGIIRSGKTAAAAVEPDGTPGAPPSGAGHMPPRRC